MGRDQDRDRQEGERRRGRIEWVIGGVSGLLVTAMIAFLLYQAVVDGSSGPLLEVRAQGVEQTRFGYRVGFRAENHGSSTAADVTIEATLESDGEVVETASVTVNYVPAKSERSGGLNFDHDPSRYRLRLRATGYTDP